MQHWKTLVKNHSKAVFPANISQTTLLQPYGADYVFLHGIERVPIKVLTLNKTSRISPSYLTLTHLLLLPWILTGPNQSALNFIHRAIILRQQKNCSCTTTNKQKLKWFNWVHVLIPIASLLTRRVDGNHFVKIPNQLVIMQCWKTLVKNHSKAVFPANISQTTLLQPYGADYVFLHGIERVPIKVLTLNKTSRILPSYLTSYPFAPPSMDFDRSQSKCSQFYSSGNNTKTAKKLLLYHYQ